MRTPVTLSRRALLGQATGSLGLFALHGLLAQDGFAGDAPAAAADPLAPRKPHFAPRAKRVIWLFMGGGPSQLETFDPKPKLAEFDGKLIPVKLPDNLRDGGKICRKPCFPFAPRGRSGIPMTDLMPRMAALADELCVIRSMACDSIDHQSAIRQMTTGDQFFPRPSLGSWAIYGLGSENRDLPAFVSLGAITQGLVCSFSNSFLPAVYQGTYVRDTAKPIADLVPARGVDQQRRQLDLIQRVNRQHLATHPGDSRLDARIASYELAFRMQTAAPEAFDVKSEPAAMRELYGLDTTTGPEAREASRFGEQCLVARRLLERGVRAIHLDCGNHWDAHVDTVKQHQRAAAITDRGCAALIADLRQRGMLDDTLVIWGGEFGRTPTGQGPSGREHHPHGFTMVMAGGGVKGGMTYGATDEFGWYAVENRVHVHDFHATVLHLLGLDHEKLTYRFGGRDYRLTDVAGHVVKAIIR